ncbi:MAG: hypothetical protein N4A68_06900 [Maledivibacter sp.]|jgi:hypothetical protein|nr:hypothetical protein [Maledivibacter sp.]
MLLTKKYLGSRGISISNTLKHQLLTQYGSPITDDDGHIFEYSEQDIYEQIRKVISNKI